MCSTRGTTSSMRPTGFSPCTSPAGEAPGCGGGCAAPAGGARALALDLKALIAPLLKLAAALKRMLTEDADELASPHRMRAEAALRGIQRRAQLQLPNWIDALAGIGEPAPSGFVDWLGVER